MAAPNFLEFLKNALQEDSHAQQQWTTYCQNNGFTADELALAKQHIRQIIRDNNATPKSQADAFFLRGILCEFGQYHTPPTSSQPFLLTAKHCYQRAASLGHLHAAEKLNGLLNPSESNSQKSLPSIDLTFKPQILRPFQQYLSSRNSWWGKIITFFFRNRELTHQKIQQAQKIRASITSHTGGYADLAAYLQLEEDIHVGVCYQYKHAYHSNLEQTSIADNPVHDQDQNTVNSAKTKHHSPCFTKSHLAQCLHNGITLAEDEYQQNQTSIMVL